MKKYSIVEVEWTDAQSYFGEPWVIKDMVQEGPILAHTVGYLLHEDKEKVIIGFMLFGDESVKHSQLIPKGMIKNMERI